MAENILEVQNLVKRFKGFTAVNDISFSIKRGEVVGLLGANGAGKTTTIYMLLGITTPTAGMISYFGKNIETHKQEILQKINFTTAYRSLSGTLTVAENLRIFAGLYSVKDIQKKIYELAEYFDITDLLDKAYWDLSSGQKTRVNLAKSLINEPEVLLMDEPTASLDPDIADKVLSQIEQLKKEKNISILFTSHNMNEISRICDRVIFLDHGKIIAHDTPLGLTKLIKKATVTIMFDAPQKDVEAYLKEKDYTYTLPRKQTVFIEVDEETIPKLLFGFGKRNIWVTDIEIKKPDLQDVFLDIARNKNNVITTH